MTVLLHINPPACGKHSRSDSMLLRASWSGNRVAPHPASTIKIFIYFLIILDAPRNTCELVIPAPHLRQSRNIRCSLSRPYQMGREPLAATPDGGFGLFAPCNCCVFDPNDWPWQNCKLRIRPCMRVCTYCGDELGEAIALRKHLKCGKHKEQQLTIVNESAGRPPFK